MTVGGAECGFQARSRAAQTQAFGKAIEALPQGLQNTLGKELQKGIIANLGFSSLDSLRGRGVRESRGFIESSVKDFSKGERTPAIDLSGLEKGFEDLNKNLFSNLPSLPPDDQQTAQLYRPLLVESKPLEYGGLVEPRPSSDQTRFTDRTRTQNKGIGTSDASLERMTAPLDPIIQMMGEIREILSGTKAKQGKNNNPKTYDIKLTINASAGSPRSGRSAASLQGDRLARDIEKSVTKTLKNILKEAEMLV